MKRNLIFHFVLAVLIMPAISCSSSKLNIYNWAYYTPPSVIEKFEAEFKVRVVLDEFASNEEMYTKIKSGGTGYDLVFPSQDYVSIMIQQGMFEKIDKTLIPNLKNIDPDVLKKTTLAHIRICEHFSSDGKQCGCGRQPGFNRTLFGQEYKNLCFAHLEFMNPDVETIDNIKKLMVLFRKMAYRKKL